MYGEEPYMSEPADHEHLMEAHRRRRRLPHPPETADDRPSPLREHIVEDNFVVICSLQVWGLGYMVVRAHTQDGDLMSGQCRVTMTLAAHDPLADR